MGEREFWWVGVGGLLLTKSVKMTLLCYDFCNFMHTRKYIYTEIQILSSEAKRVLRACCCSGCIGSSDFHEGSVFKMTVRYVEWHHLVCYLQRDLRRQFTWMLPRSLQEKD